jgi:chromatin remodeling complex protein RSC6
MVGLKLGAYVFTKKMGLQIHAKILDKKPNKSLLEQKRLMGIEGNLKFLNIKKKKKNNGSFDKSFIYTFGFSTYLKF